MRGALEERSAIWKIKPARSELSYREQMFRKRQPKTSTLELKAYDLPAGALLPVAGESHYEEALREVATRTTELPHVDCEAHQPALRFAKEDPARRWFKAGLVPEPQNTYDSNAVAVYAADGGQLGYLSRESAAEYAAAFTLMRKRGYFAGSCPAMLTGGGDKGSYGVVLALSAPRFLEDDLSK